MKKERIKKALAVLSVAALLAGGTLLMTGCKSADSSCGSSCKGKTAEEADSTSSCSAGGCGAMSKEAMPEKAE